MRFEGDEDEKELERHKSAFINLKSIPDKCFTLDPNWIYRWFISLSILFLSFLCLSFSSCLGPCVVACWQRRPRRPFPALVQLVTLSFNNRKLLLQP
jgi:hypothetical protein